jgi:hypothetical protein
MKITTKIFIAAVILLVVGILAGCGQDYRYPCQDVKNWEKPMCQQPVCAVHRDCPSHIFKNDPILADQVKN